MPLEQRKQALERRLDDGYAKIGEAEATNRDISAWEDFWLSLLAEYESVCDELEATR